MSERITVTVMSERNEAEALLTKQDVADELQVSLRTVDRYISDGVLKATRLPGGRLVRIARSSVDTLRAQGTTALAEERAS